jgi:WD40 repeat protein
MPPEQAGGKRGEVGPAADVYSLGATLYALTTGRPPFQAATAMDTVLQVLSDEPVSPRRLNPTLSRDLETICLKCLEKDPGKRYARAAALGEDLRRYLSGEPIVARPVTRLERAVKWTRRKPAIAALLALVALVTALGLGGVLWQWRTAVRQTELAQRRLYVTSVAYSPDGRRLASAGGGVNTPAELKLWDAQTRQETFAPQWQISEDNSVALSPDGQRVASAGRDGTLRVWNWVTGRETLTLKVHRSVNKDLEMYAVDTNGKLTLKEHGGSVDGVAFSRDGEQLASAYRDGTVKLWDAATGQERVTLKGHTTGTQRPAAATSVAFSTDGQRLASAYGDGTVKVWDTATGQEIQTLKGHSGRVIDVAFSRDGQRLASAGLEDGTVRVWEATTGHEIRALETFATAVDFSPDGQRLVSAGLDGTVRVWDCATGQEALALKGNSSVTNNVGARVAFSPDGQRLASASADGTVKLWDVVTGQETLTLKGHSSLVMCLAFSRDGQRLVSAGADGTMKLWDARPVDTEPVTPVATSRQDYRRTGDR